MESKVPFYCPYCNQTVMVYPSRRGPRLTCGAYQCVQRRWRDNQAAKAGKAPMDRTPKACPYCGTVYTPMKRDQVTCGNVKCTTKYTHDKSKRVDGKPVVPPSYTQYKSTALGHQAPKATIRCIRSNECCRAGYDYDAVLIRSYLKHGEVKAEDFKL